jgi:hypothetical protein
VSGAQVLDNGCPHGQFHSLFAAVEGDSPLSPGRVEVLSNGTVPPGARACMASVGESCALQGKWGASPALPKWPW